MFTAPSFRTFCGLACGFLAQTGKRTVCGMLAGTGLARCWGHDRAHRFFSRARWSLDELGLAVTRLVVALLVPAGEPVVVAIDGTLFRRRGNNGVTTDVAHMFLARNLKSGASVPQGDERIELQWMPFADAVRSVMTGGITESVSVAAILKAELLGTSRPLTLP